MKKTFLLVFSIVALAAVFGLQSCRTAVIASYNDLSMLRVGMDTTTVDKLFDDDNLRGKQTFALPNTNYTIKYVWIPVTLYTTSSSNGYGQSRTQVHYVYNAFLMLFDEGKLKFWGYQYEYNMSDDRDIRRVIKWVNSLQIKEHD